METNLKVDRRVERTRKLLQDAILALIVEQGYDSLRIEDITERANLRRATFYMHYKDKEELLFSALEATFNELAHATEPFAAADQLGGKTHVEAYLVTFQHVEQNRALYRGVLSSQSGTRVTQHIRDYLAGLILRGLQQQATAEALTMPAEIVASYIAGAELAMLSWWIEQDSVYSAAQMAQFVHDLILDGVNKLSGDRTF